MVGLHLSVYYRECNGHVQGLELKQRLEKLVRVNVIDFTRHQSLKEQSLPYPGECRDISPLFP